MEALWLSLKLASWSALGLLPPALWLGRWLAWSRHPLRAWVSALCLLPLVLPPTVIGYYLLQLLGRASWPGQLFERLSGHTLVFSFEGLLLASWLCNLPFALQPIQRAFAAIAPEIREAGACCGLSALQIFRRIEWPLAWPGILAALLLVFAHTLGEFGVILMIGGNLPGQTRTLSLEIYDRVQALDFNGAGRLSLGLLLFAFVVLAGLMRLESGWTRRG